jgi:predicted nucleic acid-binding protein
VLIAAPSQDFVEIFCAAVRGAQVCGNHVFDAQIVALCLEAGAALLTEDKGFRRYSGLRVMTLDEVPYAL